MYSLHLTATQHPTSLVLSCSVWRREHGRNDTLERNITRSIPEVQGGLFEAELHEFVALVSAHLAGIGAHFSDTHQ